MRSLRLVTNRLPPVAALVLVVVFGISSLRWPSQIRALLKGMTVSCQTYGWEWATPEMAHTLDELKSLGVNSIAIHPYAQIQNDGHVRFRAADSVRYISAATRLGA